MTFNSNGKLARLYLFFEEKPAVLPENFCDFFWGLVFRLIATLVGLWIISLFLYAIFCVLRFIVQQIWMHKIGTLYILSVCVAIGLIAALAIKIKSAKIEILAEVKTVLSGKVDSVKNRYCPRIEWVKK